MYSVWTVCRPIGYVVCGLYICYGKNSSHSFNQSENHADSIAYGMRLPWSRKSRLFVIKACPSDAKRLMFHGARWKYDSLAKLSLVPNQVTQQICPKKRRKNWWILLATEQPWGLVLVANSSCHMLRGSPRNTRNSSKEAHHPWNGGEVWEIGINAWPYVSLKGTRLSDTRVALSYSALSAAKTRFLT